VFFEIILTKPSCNRNKIPNKLTLRTNNLIINQVLCERNSKLKKHECLPKESYVRYKCRNGYIFETKRSIL
jgi:hypothetical protein